MDVGIGREGGEQRPGGVRGWLNKLRGREGAPPPAEQRVPSGLELRLVRSRPEGKRCRPSGALATSLGSRAHLESPSSS